MKEWKLACNLNAINNQERGAHLQVIKKLFNSVTKIEDDSNGYVFIVTDKPGVMKVIELFISNETKCCSFFKIQIKNTGNDIRLKISGKEGVKQFIRAEFGNYVEDLLWTNT